MLEDRAAVAVQRLDEDARLQLRELNALRQLRRPLRPCRPGGKSLDAQGEAREIETGKPVEREISAGQLHAYTIRLDTGQYFCVRADQRGADVILTLFAPGGKKLIEIDGGRSRHRERIGC